MCACCVSFTPDFGIREGSVQLRGGLGFLLVLLEGLAAVPGFKVFGFCGPLVGGLCCWVCTCLAALALRYSVCRML